MSLDEKEFPAVVVAFHDSERLPDRVAVAVSGGGDSMALLAAFLRARRDHQSFHAVTVDHSLRPESAAEAQMVADHCARIGVPHTTLIWDHGGVIDGNLMQAARDARYRLIAEWALGQGIDHVLLGHTADDNAETFLMELARSAGLAGLSGMRFEWEKHDVRWMRPFLHLRRERLRDYLRHQGIGWIDDPSNDNPQFQRVRARKALAALEPLGITTDAILKSMGHLGDLRRGLECRARDALPRVATELAGAVTLDWPAIRQEMPEVQRILLVAALRAVGGHDYPPRGPQLAEAMVAIGHCRPTTLGGCLIRATRETVTILREPREVAQLVAPVGKEWDGRWSVAPPLDIGPDGLEIRALGADGLRACPDWRATGLSRDVLIVTPAVWDGPRLIAAPPAGMANGWTAKIDRPLRDFILSH